MYSPTAVSKLIKNGKYERTDISLGKGSFGEVFVARRIEDDCLFAIKLVDKTILNERELLKCENEGEIMSRCSHPFIVQCVDVFSNERHLCFVMELCQIDLSKYITERRGEHLPEELIFQWTREIALALEYLHFNKFVHRDIKNENILINKGNVSKLGDFGLASVFEDGIPFDPETRQGSWYNLAPEVLEETSAFTEKSDMWAFGCVVYFMCTFGHAFGSGSIGKSLKLVKERNQTKRISCWGYSKGMQEIIDDLLNSDLSSRISAFELLQKPLLKFTQQFFENHLIPLDQWERINSKPLMISIKYSTSHPVNCQLKWAKMLQSEYNARIYFASVPLVKANGSIVLTNLFCERVNTALRICAVFENELMKNPPSVKTSLKIILLIRNQFDVDLMWTQLQNVTFNMEFGNEKTLMEFHDVPWNDLGNSSNPRIKIFMDDNEYHSYHGLSILSLPFNKAYKIDWNILKSKWNYQFEWNKMQQKETDARLHFPPFSFTGESPVVIHLFISRLNNSLILAGGIHKSETGKASRLTVSLRINLFCRNKHNENLTWNRKEIVTFEERFETGWFSLIEFQDISWRELSEKIAPSADITFYNSDSSCLVS